MSFSLMTEAAPEIQNEAVVFPTYSISKGHLFVT